MTNEPHQNGYGADQLNLKLIKEHNYIFMEGYENSTFKLRLMDNQIRFMEGSEVPTYISNQTMNIKSAEIENELKFGGFSWINHDGSMGLIWKGDEV